MTVDAALPDAELRAALVDVLAKDILQAWDYDTLQAYCRDKTYPPKTKRGHWFNDLRRTRDMATWTSEALLDWVEGWVKTPAGIGLQDLWDEVYLRYKLPGNWPITSARTYLLTGVKPAVTVHGVLVDDSTRSAKKLDNWTYLELRSALLHEIPSPYTPSQLLDQLRMRLGLSQHFSGHHLLKTLSDTPTEAHVDNTLFKSKLDEYKELMSKNGKNLTEQTAGMAQAMLYKAVRKVMARDMQEFYEGWDIFLDFIKQNYTTLFTPEKARRGWGWMQLSKTATTTFEDLMTLAIATRDPASRAQAVKLYDLNVILQHVAVEEERANLFVYYSGN